MAGTFDPTNQYNTNDNILNGGGTPSSKKTGSTSSKPSSQNVSDYEVQGWEGAVEYSTFEETPDPYANTGGATVPESKPIRTKKGSTTKSSPKKQRVDSGVHPENIALKKGVVGRSLPEPLPKFDQALHERVIAGNNNTFIVLGRDRPSNLASGAGGRGATQAGAIDIVVGRGGGSKDPLSDAVLVQPNFFSDAARIHISQKTNIDTNFALAAGCVGAKEDVSGIGIKADAVRVIGRTGIKLVTGKGQGVGAGPAGEKTAHGGNIGIIPCIDFIAGNDTGEEFKFMPKFMGIGPMRVKKLQPLVKGDNLVFALNAMMDHINKLQAIVANFYKTQQQFNTLLQAHIHPVVGFVTTPSAELLALGTQILAPNSFKVLSPLAAHRFESVSIKAEFLENSGAFWVCSNHVNTT